MQASLPQKIIRMKRKSLNKQWNMLVWLLVASCIGLMSCQRDEQPAPPDNEPPVDIPDRRITVDHANSQGDVMRLEKYNTRATSSPLPSPATKTWLQGLDQSVTRTWIQVRYVYNNGDYDYNYPYAGSDVGVEDALAFYSETTDSLLVALSAYNATSNYSLPEGDEFT